MSGKMCDVAIIGSGPAGYTVALYAARANLDTLVIREVHDYLVALGGGQAAKT